jgi:hypothetical protein
MDATASTTRTTFRVSGGAALAVAAAVAVGGGPAVSAAELSARNSAFTTINVPVPRSAPCHRIDEVNAALFPNQPVVGYDFAGSDAGRLAAALEPPVGGNGRPAGAALASPVAETALIRVVLLFQTREAVAFQFGADGCHAMTRDLGLDEMGRVFDQAGVRAPFGSTYFQGTGRAI